MKNAKKINKNERTSNNTPSQKQGAPTPPTLRDLTDADLEQVQGASVQIGDIHIQKYPDKASPTL